MKRLSWISASLALAGGALAPASASAAIVELGTTASPVIAPSCPKNVSPTNCTIILTRNTAIATIRDGIAYPSTVKQSGKIVAFTVGLSSLSSNKNTAKTDVHYLNQTYGGTTQVGITVLKRSGAANQRKWTVVAQSAVYHVQPYLGQVVQIPLDTTVPVMPGEVVALSTPTWAPVLSINLSTQRYAYRKSRGKDCGNTSASSQAQTRIGTTAPYTCNYPGTRVEYSATEITNPVAGNLVHARRATALRAADPPFTAGPRPTGGASPQP